MVPQLELNNPPANSIVSALAPGVVGQVYALPPTQQGGGQSREVVVEYIEVVAPATVDIEVRAGDQVNFATGLLVAPFEVLTNINTPGQTSVRVPVGRYRFIDTRVDVLTGALAEVSTRIGI
jgi:hypothetical protein